MSDLQVTEDLQVCTVVIDQTPYTSSGTILRKHELMVVSTAPKWNHDFISLAKFIVLGNGNSDIRIFKMPFSEFKDKVEKGDYVIVTISN